MFFLVDSKTFYSNCVLGAVSPAIHRSRHVLISDATSVDMLATARETGNCLTRPFAAVSNWTPRSIGHDHVRARRIPVDVDDTLHHNASIGRLIMRTNRMTSFRKHILCTNELGAKPRIDDGITLWLVCRIETAHLSRWQESRGGMCPIVSMHINLLLTKCHQ